MIPETIFSEKTVDPNPFLQFDIWYREQLNSGTAIPEAVSLGTAPSGGRVSVRTVLLKSYDESGFVFFTNYNSTKGSHLSSNPFAALHFYWPESGRQVRIEGKVKKLSAADSRLYFNSRPRESQLSAWSSKQSSAIPDRQYLEKRYEHFKRRFSDNPVPKPSSWGGYRLVPDWFEFWQNGEYRLHDRITYKRKGQTWTIERLAP